MCYFTVQAWMCLASMELWCLWADGDFGGRLGNNDLVVPCLHVVSVVTLGRKQTTWGPWLWSQISQAFGEILGYKLYRGVLDVPQLCGLRFCWQVSLIRITPVDQYHWRSTATCSSFVIISWRNHVLYIPLHQGDIPTLFHPNTTGLDGHVC